MKTPFATREKDSDSGAHSASDDEKGVGVKPGEFETLGHNEIPDPDAGLSEAERAKIVCPILPLLLVVTIIVRKVEC